MKRFYNDAELTYWDNESGDAAAAAAAAASETPTTTDTEAAAVAAAIAAKAAETQATTAVAKSGQTEKTFNQDEVNKFVGERNKVLKDKFETMEGSYENLLKQQNLTNEQREKLQTELEAVQNEMMNKEQRLEKEKKKAEEKFQTELSKAQEEADVYKELFENSTISREITDAAAKHDAFNPQHFIAHLAPKSKMIEEADSEGKPTGKLVPRVEWTTLDKETGATQTTLKTPEEAVELMKENVVDFGCLFKPNVIAGIGAGTAPGQTATTGQVDHKRISTDEYMKLAKTPEGRKQLGLSK